MQQKLGEHLPRAASLPKLITRRIAACAGMQSHTFDCTVRSWESSDQIDRIVCTGHSGVLHTLGCTAHARLEKE